jgi:hypothetical protein
LESISGLLKRFLRDQLGRSVTSVVLRGGDVTPPLPPFLQHASELILEGNVNGFSAFMDICFMCTLKNSKKTSSLLKLLHSSANYGRDAICHSECNREYSS